MIIWTGAGFYGLLLIFFLTSSVLGIDPDHSSAKFLFASTPIILILGGLLTKLAYALDTIWAVERGIGYKVNWIFASFKCNFATPPSVFFIPMPFWAVLTFIGGIEEWIRVGLV